MRTWLVHTGEPIPTDPPGDRRLRMSHLARALVDAGHAVVWWTDTFDHVRKRHRALAPGRVRVEDRYDLHVLPSRGYSRNVGLSRVLHNRALARVFHRLASREPRPDLVLTSIPIPDLADAAVAAARRAGAVAVVDVRDLWPDAIRGLAPRMVRPLADLVLAPMARQVRRALHRADARVGISDRYLEWAVRMGGRGPDARDRVFPLGYPTLRIAAAEEASAGAALRALGVDPAKQIVWFVGTFGRTYDLACPIAVARAFVETHTDVQFVFSGSGANDGRWRAEAGGLPNVVFTGHVSTAGLAYLGRVASIGLAAYARQALQGLPNKLFEYLSAGLPVVSSLEGEARDLLARHECGLGYRPGDADHLARCLQELLADPDRRARMSQRARALFERDFSAETIYPAMARHLTALAGRALGDTDG